MPMVRVSNGGTPETKEIVMQGSFGGPYKYTWSSGAVVLVPGISTSVDVDTEYFRIGLDYVYRPYCYALKPGVYTCLNYHNNIWEVTQHQLELTSADTFPYLLHGALAGESSKQFAVWIAQS